MFPLILQQTLRGTLQNFRRGLRLGEELVRAQLLLLK